MGRIIFETTMKTLAFLFFAATAIYLVVPILGYQGRPLDGDLAYAALVQQLQNSLADGKKMLHLEPAVMLQRPDEMIFMGEGTVRTPRQKQQPIPLLEKLTFRYIMVINRRCNEDDAGCYEANQLELRAENELLPMI